MTSATESMTTTNTHPQWCNKRHQAASSPNRQNHIFTWKANERRSNPLKVELYPTGPGGGHAVGSISFRAYGMHNGTVWSWMDVADARALSESLLEMADMIERGEVR